MILNVYDEGTFKLNNYHLQKNYNVMGSYEGPNAFSYEVVYN
jgi:hypothetical protein